MPQDYPAFTGDILTLTSTFSQWVAYELDDTLTEVSNFTYEINHGISTPLLLGSVFTLNGNVTRSLSTLLDLRSNFVGVNLRTDYIGSTLPTINATPTPVVGGGILTPLTFQIYFPIDTTVLWLNAPEFGDSEKFTQIRSKVYTRGNTLILFRDMSWGKQGVFEYTFTYLTEAQKDLFLYIFHISLGRHVKIVDHLGITRIGYIITPEAGVIQPVVGGWSITFTFQEELTS